MKNIVWLVITGLILLASPALPGNASPPHTSAIRDEVTVYITRTGGKYHRSKCRYLSQSKISIDKKKALANGYAACKVCKP